MLFIFLHKNKDLKKDTLGEFLEVSFFNSVIIQSNQASSGEDDFIRLAWWFNTQPINFSFTYSNPRRFTVSANRSPAMPSSLKRRIAFSMTVITSSSSVKILVRA